MSVSAAEERELQLKHRDEILEAEFSRLNGKPTYSVAQVRERLKEKYYFPKFAEAWPKLPSLGHAQR